MCWRSLRIVALGLVGVCLFAGFVLYVWWLFGWFLGVCELFVSWWFGFVVCGLRVSFG